MGGIEALLLVNRRLNPDVLCARASAQDVADSFTAASLLPGHADVAPWFSDALTPLLARA